MTLRTEFTALAQGHGVTVSELARRFGIRRKTAFTWLARVQADEADQRSISAATRLAHTDRRSHRAGARRAASSTSMLGRTQAEPSADRSSPHERACPPSTITHILRRHGLMPERTSGQDRPWKRFEHESPNDLWQMDFKGTIVVGTGRCDPLTVLDDHSRYNLVLRATPDMRSETVQSVLTDTFRRHGLPLRMNMDNGSPWGSPSSQSRGLSRLTLWMVRVGIQVSFSTPAHPQTSGKDERFHRSLKAEVVTGRTFTNHAHVQRAFDEWRDIYNTVGPHRGIGMAVPNTRYRPSPRPFPEVFPAIEYSPNDHVAMVQWNGVVRFKGRTLKVSNALHGMPPVQTPRKRK